MKQSDSDPSGKVGPDNGNRATHTPGGDERMPSADYLEKLREEHEHQLREHTEVMEPNPRLAKDVMKKPRRRPPLPEYARDMTLDEINRSVPLYFLMRWEFYLALVAFVLFAAYFPWSWVADWGIVRVLVAAMERIVPSIAGLPSEARHLPREASKAQLSFIHFCCAVTFTYKMITQRAAVWRVASKARFLVGSTAASTLGSMFVYLIFFWTGHFNHGAADGWHGSRLEVAGCHTAFWLLLTLAFSMAWSGLQEVIRQLKRS